MKKRIVSLLMALALCLSLLPTAALAAEGEPAEQLVEQEQLEPVEPTKPTPAEPEEGAPVEDAEEEEKEELPEEQEQEQQEEQDAPALLLAAAPRAVEGETHSHPICGDKDCTTHGEQTWTAVSSLDGLVAGRKYYLTQDVTLDKTWQPANIFLCLNGHKITGADGKAVIDLAITTFTLTDCKGTGKITHDSGESGSGVYISGGTFEMYGGSITGNTTGNTTGYGSGYSSGVSVVRGNFNMYGGSITGNTTGNTNGGGVYVNSYGNFTMTGGSISDNNVGTGENGGGVYVNGTFTMSGGEIRNNTAPGTGDGGGVFVNYNGTFNMSDDSRITGNTAFRGGGVCVERNSVGSNNYKPGNFAMSSGTIGGKATNDANQAEYGGGVYVAGAFTLTGGSITGNKTNGNGGGVYVNAGSTFTVSGAPKITDNTQKPTISSNVYLITGKPGAVIVIGDAHLASGAKIGVKTGETPTDGTPVTIATNANSGDKQYFSSDESEYSMYVEGSELKLAIVPAHEHRWTYTASNATTITATCGDDSCTSKDGGSVTIKAPAALTYDGTTKAATVDKDTGNWQGGKVNIAYKQGDKVLTGAPVNAGTYTASITLGGATASVTYTITKATPSCTVPTGLTATYGQTLKDVTLPSGWSWKNSGESVGNATGNSAAMFKAVFTPADTTNYNTVNEEISVKVNKAPGKDLGTIVLEQRYTDKTEHTQALDWRQLPKNQQWSYNCVVSRTIAKKDLAVGGTVLTYQVTDGKANETITFTIKATCSNYEDYTYTVTLNIVDRINQPNFKFAESTKTATYGDADFTVTANGQESGSTVTYASSNENVATVGNDGKVRIVGVGTVTITAKAGETADYNEATASYTLMVNKRTITVTADNKTMTVNGKLPEFTVSYGNLPDGVKAEDIFGTLPTASTTADGKTVGEFDIAVTESSLKDDCKNNYTVEIAKGKLTVTKQSGGYYYYTPAAGGTTDANKSPRTGDAGLLVYGLTALSSYTGTALVLRRKRED